MPDDASIYVVWSFVVVTALAAAWDLRTGLIPNRLLLAGALVCVPASLLPVLAREGALGGLRQLGAALLGLALVSLGPLLLYRSGGLGGGDLKLLALLGAVLGPAHGLEAELYAFVIAGLYAPVRLLWDGTLRHSLATSLHYVRAFFSRGGTASALPAASQLTSLRFGPAIFLGTLLVALGAHGAAP
jgi:prepilin peptidase CpaA